MGASEKKRPLALGPALLGVAVVALCRTILSSASSHACFTTPHWLHRRSYDWPDSRSSSAHPRLGLQGRGAEGGSGLSEVAPTLTGETVDRSASEFINSATKKIKALDFRNAIDDLVMADQLLGRKETATRIKIATTMASCYSALARDAEVNSVKDNMYKEAFDCFERALTLCNPDDWVRQGQVLSRQSWIECKAGQTEEAVRTGLKAIDMLKKDDVKNDASKSRRLRQALLMQKRIYEATGQVDLAYEMAFEAVSLQERQDDPSAKDVKDKLPIAVLEARGLIRDGQLNEAGARLEEYVKKVEARGGAQTERSYWMVLLQLGDCHACIADGADAAEVKGSHLQKAKAAYEQSLALIPDGSSKGKLFSAMGEVEKDLGNLKQATRRFMKSTITLKPLIGNEEVLESFCHAVLELRALFMQSGRPDRAKAMLREFKTAGCAM